MQLERAYRLIMKVLLVTLLLAVSVQAQSLGDVARRERLRQAHLKPDVVIKGQGFPPSTVQPKGMQPEVEAVTPVPLTVDSTREWNEQIRRLLAKIQDLQAMETATELQINELNNKIFAPVIDQPTKDQALASLEEAREKLAAVGLELSQTTQNLETIEILGPPRE